ncbi:3'(2'),5'-bisphosphate nucleotidase CysQ [Mucilaginibacter aquariorum]|uniref:3'(2'),5'-bisphosphate nucleotidase CysQ n=1 Tax=Mucilaginibacter aquariorum TaxID=2967225 RepID=A0ABT1SVM5_9SPHI|nr:3'(2'),5'-bisphosphate nucleotidase CysQ [Mucilaginibacter aquariorum]MCQ6956386.1 3'(2'),5'-bisphosphate nucleotidase CysQ [Mucilaginibacter aquariorum]
MKLTELITFPDLTGFSLNRLLEIAKHAGMAILKVYAEDSINVIVKGDNSPLTLADQASNEVIITNLKELTPAIPVISEEEKDILYEIRKEYQYYWCVDPLDGTKEFIKRNGEFTVNIALIRKDKPVFGVIYVPVTGELFYGGKEYGSWKLAAGGQKKQLKINNKADSWTAVGSRSHAADEEIAVQKMYPVAQTVSVGSSLKFCLIAEGLAQIYYRHGPTMEWDTASGQAIAEGAGAVMTTPDGQPFMYNKTSLLNGPFLVKVR